MWPTWFNKSDKTKPGPSPESTAKHLSLSAHLRGEAKQVWSLRKREFDKLRQLRRSEIESDDKPKQKFFHTSMLTELRDKASTIQKIDAIEAQMSMKWWKTEAMEYESPQSGRTK